MEAREDLCYNDQISSYILMDTHLSPKRPSLLKQALGAAAGAVIALLLYQGYKMGAPVVTAWLVVPQSQIIADHPGTVRANQAVGVRDYNRLAAKANEIYKSFAEEPGPTAVRTRKGIEVSQPLLAQASSVARVDLEDLQARSSVASSFASAASSAALSASASFGHASSLAGAVSDAAAQANAKLAGAKLPNSGLGMSLAVLLAGCAAIAMKKKRACP